MKFTRLFILFILLQSCWGEKGEPNYEYMPNMYEPLSYEAYSENFIYDDNLSARLPLKVQYPEVILCMNMKILMKVMIWQKN